MRKYLLTGGFATALLLGACSGEESGSSESAEEETIEEVTEEETTEEATENAEMAETSAEDETKEEDTLEPASSAEEDKAEVVKTSEGLNETLELDTIRLNVVGADMFSTTATQEVAMLSEDFEAGDDLAGVVIEYNMENTSEEPRMFYISQAQIITNTGEQIDSELLLADGLQDDMKGAVKSSGKVPYYFKNSTAEEVEYIDIVIPTVSNGETFETLTEEQKVRIEF